MCCCPKCDTAIAVINSSRSICWTGLRAALRRCGTQILAWQMLAPATRCLQSAHHDIHTGCNEGAAASARAFPKAAVQQTVAALADAAVSSKGSKAQVATFAKSQDLPPGQRSHAARAMEGTDLRCRCSHQPLSNGREADEAIFRRVTEVFSRLKFYAAGRSGRSQHLQIDGHFIDSPRREHG